MKKPNIKYPSIIFAPLLFLFSCATILNRPVQKISISTGRNIKIISIDKVALVDTTFSGMDSARKFYVKRSKNLIEVDLQIDSLNKPIFLKPKNSFAFWLNFSSYGIGMLVDIANPKRYAYSSNYHLTAEDTSNKRYRFIPTPTRIKHRPTAIEKGAINFSLSAASPVIFNMKSIDGIYKSVGILGLEAGLDYFYSDNRYLSINVGGGTDILPVEHLGSGYTYRGSTIFANARNNFVFGSLNCGYGISISKFNWEEYSNDPSKNSHSLSNFALGLSLSTQYRIRKKINIGILYQPGLVNTSFKPAFQYQHYISTNVIWKLPIRKK